MKGSAFVAILMMDQQRANELAAKLSEAGHRTLIMASSDELYEISSRETIDVFVCESRLRGFLSGLEIVQRLHDEMLQPAALLISGNPAKDQAQAEQLGVHRVLSSAASLSEVTDAAISAAKVSLVNRPVTRPLAQRIVAQADGVEPLPQVIVTLAGSLRGGEGSPEELHDILAGDPDASADALRWANSSALGRANRTSSLLDAIRFLGVRRTIPLVLSSGLVRAQGGLMRELPKQVRTWYSYRSVLIASTAESFARHLEQVPPETAHILGLLQDVGILVLGQTYGQRYFDLLQRVQEIAHLRLEPEERAELGISHAEVSAALLRKWRLPETMIGLVDRHHQNPLDTERPKNDSGLLRVMQIGEAVAGISDRRTPQRYMILNQLLAHYGRRSSVLCQTSLAEAVKRVGESGRLLSLPVPPDPVLAELSADLTGYADYGFSAAASDSPAPAADAGPVEVAEWDVPDAMAADAADAGPSQQPTVLVIEDEESVVKVIRLFLKPLGVDVLHGSGYETVRDLAPSAGAILCDVHLGDENGIDVIRQLRREGFAGPVIMVSGDRYRETVQKSLEVGISGYILKPFSKAILLEKLRQHPGLLPEREMAAVGCA